MLEFLGTIDKLPKTLLIVFFVSTIVLLIVSIWLAVAKPFCEKCPDCVCNPPIIPPCPACNCAPCPECKQLPQKPCEKCKPCYGEEIIKTSPCASDSFTDCSFDPKFFYDQCVLKSGSDSPETKKGCAWRSSLHILEKDKASCKTKCMELCPAADSVMRYDCPTYCENECCNYDFYCRAH